MPLTSDVLRVIGKAGIVVGSVARGKQNPKDIDIVVRDRGTKNKNPVFAEIIKRWNVISYVPGHLCVNAEPLSVEMFEYDCYDTGDVGKNAQRTTYRKARKHVRDLDVCGVTMQAIDKPHSL